MSCISSKWFSSLFLTSFSSSKAFGIETDRDVLLFLLSIIGCGVLIPATTSSPWAFGNHSPKKTFSPVEGFRVKATPVPQFFPRFPKTIACTFTAVPIEEEIFSKDLYSFALFPFQLSNTAATAP